MQLPVELKSTHHKWGGRIERIHSCSHAVAKPEDGRSRDTWFFIGDVVWDDGSGSSIKTEIAPFMLSGRGHEGMEEINALCELMNDYLEQRGRWFREGESKHEGWYANERPKIRRRA